MDFKWNYSVSDGSTITHKQKSELSKNKINKYMNKTLYFLSFALNSVKGLVQTGVIIGMTRQMSRAMTQIKIHPDESNRSYTDIEPVVVVCCVWLNPPVTAVKVTTDDDSA